jgi:signal transduction histidine kinase
MASEPLSTRLKRTAAGVRFRTTAAAVLVVGVVLGVGFAVITIQTESRLERSIQASAEARANDIAALVEADAVQDPLPGGSRDLLAQVVAPSGEVIASSPGLSELGAFADTTPPAGAIETSTATDLLQEVEDEALGLEDQDPYRIVVLGVSEGGVVQVAASLEPAQEAVNALTPLLLVGLPIVLGVVGLVVWNLTGRALQPVEAMREQAEDISAAELERRLPVPTSQDEVHRLALTLNAMLDRLEAAAVQQRRFVADASHELKSPVAAMRTMLEVAASTPDFDDWDLLIADLTREDRRMERLVGDLLILARSDEGALALRRVEVDLDQVIGSEADAVAATFSGRIDAGGLQPMRIWGDPDGLSRVFRNLLDNAARHATAVIEVRSRQQGESVFVTVSDDGPGIGPADRERVFERFVRLDEARSRDEGGTRLGLAVARAVTRHHGGDVRFVDPEGGGTSVEVRLPNGESTPITPADSALDHGAARPG